MIARSLEPKNAPLCLEIQPSGVNGVLITDSKFDVVDVLPKKEICGCGTLVFKRQVSG